VSRSGDRPDFAVFVATSGHSGVDTIVRQLTTALSDRGMSIDVLRIQNHGPDPAGLPPGVRLVAFRSRHVETSLLSLVRYLRRYRPKVLLTDKDSVNRLAIVARWLARVDTRLVVRLGTRVSVNLRHKRRWQAALQGLSMRWLYRRADAWVVPSRGAAADLARHIRLPQERISVLPNPVVDPALRSMAVAAVDDPWLNEGDGMPLIVAVGSLTERKDYAMLIRAFARLRAARACRLLVIGKGRCREALECQARELGVDTDVRFTGFLNNPYPYIAAADVFAHTSRWEGLGIVLIEALALGTPVVATDCPSGPAAILDGGRIGALVPVGDEKAMARALARTIGNPPDSAFLVHSVAGYDRDRAAHAYQKVLGLREGRDGDL